MIYYILVYITAFLLISTVSWQSWFDYLGKRKSPTHHGGGNDDWSLMSRMRKKVVFSPPCFFFDYKNVALIVLRAALPCLTACISRKHPMLIYSFFVHCLVSLWILSVMRQKNPSFSRSWHQVSSFNEKVVGSSLLLSSSLWDQAPIWGVAGFESQPMGSSSNMSFGWVWVPSEKECSFSSTP